VFLRNNLSYLLGEKFQFPGFAAGTQFVSYDCGSASSFPQLCNAGSPLSSFSSPPSPDRSYKLKRSNASDLAYERMHDAVRPLKSRKREFCDDDQSPPRIEEVEEPKYVSFICLFILALVLLRCDYNSLTRLHGLTFLVNPPRRVVYSRVLRQLKQLPSVKVSGMFFFFLIRL
jgi:hypothetical protein